ncbi:DUF6461 domain-containing protein [Spirillospora sp. NPDC029432]|uniref:DUF6461 domain-containing protein n=1 Tax=Spirillospora sp. NPDC029432 TaxID=3154599 RepID=UPI003454BE1F
MIKIAEDFQWTSRCPGDPHENYAVMMVRGLTSQDLLQRLNARPVDPPRITGAESLYEHWMDEWAGDDDLVGVFTIDDWAVAFEPGAHLLADDDVLTRLSAGTRLVCHSGSVYTQDHFYWLENGDLRLYIKPHWSEEREGTAADDLLEDMRAIGFRFAEDEGEEDPIAKAFALAEHITGVGLTEETFEQAVYLLGAVPG